LTVFTSIALDFDEEGLVTQLVSVRDETLLNDEVFEGNAPIRKPSTPEVGVSSSINNKEEGTQDDNDSPGSDGEFNEEIKSDNSSSAAMFSNDITGIRILFLSFLVAMAQ
jgi:hypothetical protein